MSKNFLYPFKSDFLWGYKNENDQTIIEPVFDYVEPFTSEIAVVRYHGKNNILNKKGELLIESGANLIEKIGPNNWSYEVGDSKGLVSTSGKLLTPPVYKNFLNFSEGMVGVRTEKGCGYLDEDGKMVIPDIFSIVRPFYDALTIVTKMDGEDILLNQDFEEVIDDDLMRKYEVYLNDLAQKLDQSLSEVKKPKGNTELIKCIAKGLYSFRDLDTHLEGICNKKGKILLDPEYDLIEEEVNGFFPAFMKVKYIELEENYFKMLDSDICSDCMVLKEGYVRVAKHRKQKFYDELAPGVVASHFPIIQDRYGALNFHGGYIAKIIMHNPCDIDDNIICLSRKKPVVKKPKTKALIAKNKKKLYGLKSPDKEILLPFEYDEIIPADDYHVFVKKDGNYSRYHIEDGFTEGFEMNWKSYPNRYENVIVLPNGRFIGCIKILEDFICKGLL